MKKKRDLKETGTGTSIISTYILLTHTLCTYTCNKLVLGRQYPSDRSPLVSGRILPSIAGGQRGDPFPFPSTLRTHPLLHHAAELCHLPGLLSLAPS